MSFVRASTAHGVYPRVCGGTPCGPGRPVKHSGLSPRVRGNRQRHFDEPPNRGSIPACAGEPHGRLRLLVDHGSIPACAGEPPPFLCPLRRIRVYPRVCGGTMQRFRKLFKMKGLSPRVRGNLGFRMSVSGIAGSIPACAGEPLSRGRAGHGRRVYPRVCGGTWQRHASTALRWGLSPRVRGNPEELRHLSRRIRSIPACAGEPCPSG